LTREEQVIALWKVFRTPAEAFGDDQHGWEVRRSRDTFVEVLLDVADLSHAQGGLINTLGELEAEELPRAIAETPGAKGLVKLLARRMPAKIAVPNGNLKPNDQTPSYVSTTAFSEPPAEADVEEAEAEWEGKQAQDVLNQGAAHTQAMPTGRPRGRRRGQLEAQTFRQQLPGQESRLVTIIGNDEAEIGRRLVEYVGEPLAEMRRVVSCGRPCNGKDTQTSSRLNEAIVRLRQDGAILQAIANVLGCHRTAVLERCGRALRQVA
jgi:hypothetical protein